MSTVHIPRIDDFLREARRLRREGRLLLLLVSQEDCPYCALIKAEIIRPMIIAGDFGERILIRELFIDEGEEITDFAGRQVAASDFAHGYGVFVTPTLLFLAPDGRELVKQMVGINTVEMYFYYVEQSIRRALAELTA